MVGGQVEAAGVALDAAERASAHAAEEPFEPSVGPAASLLANTGAAITVARGWLAWLRGDPAGTAGLAAQAGGELTDDDCGPSVDLSACGGPSAGTAGPVRPSSP